MAWEVQGPEQRATTLETRDVMSQLAYGSLGIHVKVRRVGEPAWVAITQVPEFIPLCPYVNPQYSSNSKIGSMVGNLVVSNDLQKLVDVSTRIRSTPDFYNRVGFAAPILAAQFPGTASLASKIFRLWDNFWIGSLLMPAQASIGDGNAFNLYLYALNTNTSRQDHELHSYDYPIPNDQMSNLSFSVPAGGMVLHQVRIPVSKHKGEGVHVLTFRTKSTSDKLAKGALVGALTLGSVIYKEGHKGFSVTLRVVSPQALQRAPPPMTVPSNPMTSKPQPAQTLKAFFCRSCGSSLVPDSRFCARCGTPIVV